MCARVSEKCPRMDVDFVHLLPGRRLPDLGSLHPGKQMKKRLDKRALLCYTNQAFRGFPNIAE